MDAGTQEVDPGVDPGVVVTQEVDHVAAVIHEAGSVADVMASREVAAGEEGMRSLVVASEVDVAVEGAGVAIPGEEEVDVEAGVAAVEDVVEGVGAVEAAVAIRALMWRKEAFDAVRLVCGCRWAM